MSLGTTWDVSRRGALGMAASLVMAIASGVGSPAFGDDLVPKDWLDKSVVLKSLKTDLRIVGRVVPAPAGRVIHLFQIKKIEKDWIWIVDEGYKGWVKRGQVVPTDEAEAYFTGLIAREPRSAEARYMRGSLRKDKARIDDLTEAIRIDPSFAAAYAARAGAHSEGKDINRALDDWARAIRLNPDLAVAYIDRAGALEDDDPDCAIDDLTEAIRIDPGNSTAYAARGMLWQQQKVADRAVADLTDALRLYEEPEDEFLAMLIPRKEGYLITRGDAWLDQKQYDRAIDDYTEVIRLCARKPKPSPIEDLDSFFSGQRKKVAAVAEFKRADVQGLKKDWDRSIADYSLVIETEPTFAAAAYNNRGLIRKKAKDIEGALADFDESIRTADKPKLKMCSYINRSVIKSHRKDVEGALADCEAAMTLAPEESFTYVVRGSIRLNGGSYDDALADFAKCVEVDPRSPWGHASRAWIWATCPDPKFRDGKKAVEEATRACDLSGWTKPYCLTGLAAAEAEAGDFDAAVKWQEKALELVTDDEDKSYYRDQLELFRKKKPYRDIPEGDVTRKTGLGLPDLNLAAG